MENHSLLCGIRAYGTVRIWIYCCGFGELMLNFGSSLAATAMQHICLAKALLLIREFEVYEISLTRERRLKLKVDLKNCVSYDFPLMVFLGANF